MKRKALASFLATAPVGNQRRLFDPTVAQFQHLGAKFTFEHFCRNKIPSAA
jgi:hypothetical protein